MNIAVRYMAQLKTAAGCAAEQVELDASASVTDLVGRLARQHGEPLAGLLLDAGGRPQPTILVFVGDQQVVAGQSLVLKDGDVLTFLSPMAGG